MAISLQECLAETWIVLIAETIVVKMKDPFYKIQ